MSDTAAVAWLEEKFERTRKDFGSVSYDTDAEIRWYRVDRRYDVNARRRMFDLLSVGGRCAAPHVGCFDSPATWPEPNDAYLIDYPFIVYNEYGTYVEKVKL